MDKITKIVDPNDPRLRGYDLENAEVKDTMFTGHSIVYNRWSVDVGGYVEMIAPGAWDSADYSECLAVFNHREDNLLGTYKAGTLRFFNETEGVRTEVDFADTTHSRNCQEWVRRREIDTQSFKFTVLEDEWVYDENADLVRCTIKAMNKVFDTSLVTRAAYKETSVKFRSAGNHPTPAQIKEAFNLRGFSDKAANEAYSQYIFNRSQNRIR